jgi:hypothetical protein
LALGRLQRFAGIEFPKCRSILRRLEANITGTQDFFGADAGGGSFNMWRILENFDDFDEGAMKNKISNYKE